MSITIIKLVIPQIKEAFIIELSANYQNYDRKQETYIKIRNKKKQKFATFDGKKIRRVVRRCQTLKNNNTE